MALLTLDASAGVELLLRSDAGRRVGGLLQGSTVTAPAHFDAEVFSALGRLARGGELSEERVAVALDLLAGAPVERLPVAPLLGEAWTLRHNLALRDALYVVLARRLGGTLLTADGRLAQAPNLDVPVLLAGRGTGV